MISLRLAGRIVGVAVLAGGAALWISPETRMALAPLIGMAKGVPSKQPTERDGDHGPPGTIKLTADQITKARIELIAVEGCTITQQITAPGAVTPDADLRARVGREGQESEIYVIADLSVRWVDLSVPTSDLANVAVGQPATITAGQAGLRADAKVIFVSPILQADTRSARVIAAMDNAAMAWRPGAFVTSQITLAEQSVDL